MSITASELRQLPADELEQALTQLDSKQLEDLKYNWKFWARPEQLEPVDRQWRIWFINAGRGFGKTRAGVEWVREQVKKGKKRIAAVAATNSDIERVMVKGPSGFLSCCWKGDKTNRGAHMGMPYYSPTKRTLVWENGAEVQFFSAEEPERLRGPNFEMAWCDELAAWNKDQDTWDMLQMTLRIGNLPRICVTTTPKPTKLVRSILKRAEQEPEKVRITRGSSYDNQDNIDVTALQQYEGTRLGRQELYAEILEEAEGALWNTDMLDACQVSRDEVPELKRIVVSIDPAITSNAESDMTGIVVTGIDLNGICYVLGDYTDRYTPQGWANKAIQLYEYWEADRIVAEKNQGGDMVRNTIQVENDIVPIKLVHASRGKMARAEPVSALYERGFVKHVRNPEDGATLEHLETQMRTWEPLGSIGSPDRLDALVWSVTELAMGSRQQAPVNLLYKNKHAV